MRILIVGDVYSIHVRRWASYFAPKHEVHVAYLPRNSEERVRKLFGPSERINLVPLGSPFMTNLKRIPREISMKTFGGKYYMTLGLKELENAIDRIKPDIVHAHYLPDYGWLASQAGFRPLVLHMWGCTILFKGRDKNKKLAAQMFAAADAVFAGDEPAKDRLVEFGCAPEKVIIQAWGVDTGRFTPAARSDALRSTLLDTPAQCLITIAYALEDFYHVETLVEAAQLLVRKKVDTKILIIGDGAERKRLEGLASSLDVTGYVKFLGWVEHEKIHEYIASSDIYVDTFFTDKAGGGIGVAMMEAMSSGVPVIGAGVRGKHAGIIDGENGLFFKGGNPEDLASKLLLLINSPEKRKSFGEKGRRRALAIGDWHKNMAVAEAKYIELAGNQPIA